MKTTSIIKRIFSGLPLYIRVPCGMIFHKFAALKPCYKACLRQKSTLAKKKLKIPSKYFACLKTTHYLCSPKFYGLEDIYKYVTAYQNKA